MEPMQALRTNDTKLITYAYPTSDNAVAYADGMGCYLVYAANISTPIVFRDQSANQQEKKELKAKVLDYADSLAGDYDKFSLNLAGSWSV